MNLFDLLFVVCFLGAVAYAGWILSLAAQRNGSSVRSHSLRLAAAMSVYLAIVIGVGQSSPRRVLAADQTLGYDDWHVGIERVVFADAIDPNPTAASASRFAIVKLHIVSTARRVSQAAPTGARVYLVDEHDVRYDESVRGQAAYEASHGAQPALTATLDPGGSFATTRVFEVPRAAKTLALGHRHGNGSWFPGKFIIGEGFRPAPVIRLPMGAETEPAGRR